MVIKVLAIGDVGSIIRTIRKYTKKSEIRLINYPQDGSGVFTAPDDVELFNTWKVQEHVKKINEIKDNFDICLTTASERVAYLADLNYVAYYLGRDIDVPRFKKIPQKSGKTSQYSDVIFLKEHFTGMHLKTQWRMSLECGSMSI